MRLKRRRRKVTRYLKERENVEQKRIMRKLEGEGGIWEGEGFFLVSERVEMHCCGLIIVL
jgi:hypothetical protein